MKQYKSIIFDDFEINDYDKIWSRICKTCATNNNINIEELDEDGSGICGVSGCSNEADFYIDLNN